MSKKILIDASNANETRIAVTENGKLDDFEVESNQKHAVKGDVYLATIIRVEPSLQAAFVDFGSNRNGFLPLTEIHPDYFKIPSADESKLKELIEKQSKIEEIEDDDETEEKIENAEEIETEVVEVENEDQNLKKFKTKKNHFNLSKNDNLNEAANNLYRTLRKIKNSGFKSIIVNKIPNIGIGIAINDRLKRASNK